MNRTVQCSPFANVAASGVAYCDLNSLLGSSLECLNLQLGGGAFTKSMLTLLQLKANGKVVWESNGANADAREAYMNYATTQATTLSLNFMDPKAKTPNAFQVGALNLFPDGGIVSLRLEATIAGATTPSLTANAELSPGQPMPGEQQIRNLFARRHRVSYTVGAAGTFPLPIPHMDPAGGGSVYRRIFLYSANCTGFKAMRDGVVDQELISVNEIKALQLKAGRAPQAGLVVFDPVLDGLISGRVWDTSKRSGVKAAQFFATFSAGETITIETEELLPLSAY